MRKTALLLLFVLANLTLLAQAPSGYYNNANGKDGEELKIALHNIIYNHNTIGYSSIWSAFYTTDHRTDNVTQVWDIYSDIPGSTPPYVYELGDNQCGEYSNEGDCYNREHSWPQSWFGNQNKPKSDMHHIYPTDGKVNAERGNLPYGEVKKATWTSLNGSKVGTPKTELGYTGSVFEPIDAFKGDIARSLFYMSVCYYQDDSDWGTSGMTNKSEILPWAMTMLLRWSDEDPVSQKEVDRNNAVYAVQGNRNPFIDHPEYAHMIWDDGWNGTLYNITCATGLSHGSVSTPESALEGSTVAITATPSPGYMVSSYSVYKTGSPSTTVAVSGNGTFVMPAFAVTVSATFVQNTQQYAITKGAVSHGSISVSATSTLSGSTVTMTATPDNGYSLHSWYVYKTGDINTDVYHGITGSFIMPAYDVTVTATFAQGNGGNFVKVTSGTEITNGDYLIVNETYNVAFNGGLTTLDANNNYIGISINSNTIESTATTLAAKFTIEKSGDNYTIKSTSGFFVGATSNSNSLLSNTTTAYTNTISYNNGDIDIIGAGGAYMRYNNGNQRFRYYKSSTYTDQQPIQLYKKTSGSTPTHTIYFNPNGGSGTMTNQTVNEYESTTLETNTFSRDGFEFDGWNTAANGTGTYYANGATITLLDNLTLYAQWNQKYNINIIQTSNGTISANTTSAVEESLITLTATPNANYELDYWTVTDILGNNIEVIENQFEMPASDITVSATFVYVGIPFAQKYHPVTSTDQLVAGRTYLIVNTQNGKALGTTQNGNNRSAENVSISNGIIESIENTICELTLGSANDHWTFFDSTYNNNAGGYLYAASSSSNWLRTQTTNNANGEWAITLNNGNATIEAQGANTRNLLKYNNQSTIFSCYASGQQDVQLFIRSENYDITHDTTLAKIFKFDYCTVHSGATLTVTGTVTCDAPNHIIIEEGGQFIHHNDGVQATFMKDIAAYTENGGWYTIATPFANFTPSQIATASYDLYAYDENGIQEWINYKADQSGFPVNVTSGYLYAHNPTTILRMTGTLNSGNYTESINLGYANNDTHLQGFNLLGNPTAHDITFNKSGNVSDGYYYLDNSDSWIYEPSNTVPAGRGFLVKANAEGQTVSLNPQTRGSAAVEAQNIASFQQLDGTIVIDLDGERAYVKMTDGISMPLLEFRGHTPSVFLIRDKNPYIMLVKDDAQSVDLCYLPKIAGLHRISVSAGNTPPCYLHLIDNLTGADVDLLATPNYTFNAMTDDYATRFHLVFSANGSTNSPQDNDDFAFISNGQIIINGSNSNATLQVVDMLGRIVIQRRGGTCTVSTDAMVPGVYVLHLIDGEKSRTQKIIIPKLQ